MDAAKLVLAAVGCCCSALLAALWRSHWLSRASYTLLFAAILYFILGGLLGLLDGINKSIKAHISNRCTRPSSTSSPSCKEEDLEVKPSESGVVFSRGLDAIIGEILDLIIHDQIDSWYSDFGGSQEFSNIVRTEAWQALRNLSARLTTVNWVELLMEDFMVTVLDHFQQIRLAAKSDGNCTASHPFKIHQFICSKEAEERYMRVLSEFLANSFLSHDRLHHPVLRGLVAEGLFRNVLAPTVDRLSEPDWINQNLLHYLISLEKFRVEHKKTYSYAPNYEGFIKIIETCFDVDNLKQLRYDVISEILNATAINSLKKVRITDTAPRSSPPRDPSASLRREAPTVSTRGQQQSQPKGTTKGGSSKVVLLQGRDLKRYINNLTVAKIKCEKRIVSLGGEGYAFDSGLEVEGGRPTKKVILFDVIMSNDECRACFRRFLQLDGNESLLDFYSSISHLRAAHSSVQHRMASEIYEQFLNSSSSAVRLDKVFLFGMEAFIMGNRGPDLFYKAQEVVYKQLREHSYPSFIISEPYEQFIPHWNTTLSLSTHTLAVEAEVTPSLPTKCVAGEYDEQLEGGSTDYFTEKIGLLDERIFNKTQALQTLRSSKKHIDGKLVEVIGTMEKELAELHTERRHLDHDEASASLWWDHIGQWSAKVHQPTTMMSDSGSRQEERLDMFEVTVSYGSSSADQRAQRIIERTLDDVRSLNDHLLEMGRGEKKGLPWAVKLPFQSSPDSMKMRAILEEYLNAVLRDEKVMHSDAVYKFFSLSTGVLYSPLTGVLYSPPLGSAAVAVLDDSSAQPDTTSSLGTAKPDEHPNEKFFSKLFQRKKKAESEELLLLDDEGIVPQGASGKDSVAKRFYEVLNEVFEFQGAFRLMRSSFITLVQATYGKSINRQLRETVSWVVSQPMLIHYLKLVKAIYWPADSTHAHVSLSDEDKLNCCFEAKRVFLRNIPDIMKTLFGDHDSKLGCAKCFEVLQDKELNKHLIYNLLHHFLMRLFPELHVEMDDLAG